jgi:hypothetical protein
MTSPTSNNNDEENTWPVVVWSLLQDASFVLETWCFIPLEWRTWWVGAILRLHTGIRIELLLALNPVFHDATSDCILDTTALNNDGWVGIMIREEHLVIPSVKCPAGCSEFKHKCNELPFDLVFQELLRRPINVLLQPESKRCIGFTRIFRRDYLLPEKIANNPEWLCRPTISKTGNKAPIVLCCRYHSVTSKHQMVHAPRNPTGNLSSSFLGNLSR